MVIAPWRWQCENRAQQDTAHRNLGTLSTLPSLQVSHPHCVKFVYRATPIFNLALKVSEHPGNRFEQCDLSNCPIRLTCQAPEQWVLGISGERRQMFLYSGSSRISDHRIALCRMCHLHV